MLVKRNWIFSRTTLSRPALVHHLLLFYSFLRCGPTIELRPVPGATVTGNKGRHEMVFSKSLCSCIFSGGVRLGNIEEHSLPAGPVW